MNEALLNVQGLSVEFATDAGWQTVVHDVGFTLRPGETLGIVGESGSGKTVTGLALLGLLPEGVGRIRSGSVQLEGTELVGASRRRLQHVRGDVASMVFQEPMTSLDPAFRIGDQIAEVYRCHRDVSRRAATARAIDVLDRVGIPDAARRSRSYPHEFSGGMRQRALIAMALVCEPRVLIADEPTTALDVTVQAQVLELLADLRDELDMAMLFITHDLGVVAGICDRVTVMYAGQVVEQADVEQIFDRPAHPYTRALLEAIPRLDTANRIELATIPGRIPPPSDPPSGCRFHPRCAYAIDACRQREQDAEPDEGIVMRELPGQRRSRCLRVHELDLGGVA